MFVMLTSCLRESERGNEPSDVRKRGKLLHQLGNLSASKYGIWFTKLVKSNVHVLWRRDALWACKFYEHSVYPSKTQLALIAKERLSIQLLRLPELWSSSRSGCIIMMCELHIVQPAFCFSKQRSSSDIIVRKNDVFL